MTQGYGFFDRDDDDDVTANAETARADAEEALSDAELQAIFDEASSRQTNHASATAAQKADPAAQPVQNTPAEETALTDAELQALFDEASSGQESTSPVSTAREKKPDPVFNPADYASADHSDKSFYERVGGILRELHDALREVGHDHALHEAANEIHDAQGRLEYVAGLTEKAATRVLNSIDVALPKQEEMIGSALALEKKWADLLEGRLDIESFKQLAFDSQAFISASAIHAKEEKARLMEIMMAQDFQDITGQVIKKVIFIARKLEYELARLLWDNVPPEQRAKQVDLLSGPDVPEKAMDQQDVDSLLASLGF